MNANHFVVAFIFLLLFTTSSISLPETVNQSNFPWLQTGAYADYSSNFLNNHPWFVTSDGNLLIPITQGTTSSSELNWSVSQRTVNTADIILNYSIFGNENPQNWLSLKESNENYTINFNYTISLAIVVELASNTAYVKDIPDGIVNFWSSPLPEAGEQLTIGTIMLSSIQMNVTSSASAISQTYLPVTPIVSGVAFAGTLKQYQLMNSMLFAPSSGNVGWENYSVQSFVNGSIAPGAYTNLDPVGDYDYYNGLALSMNVPDYPVNRTVCELNNSRLSDCSDRSFSTALGQYFHTISGSLLLVRTNISLEPESAGTVNPATQLPELLIASAVVIFAISGGAYFSRRVSKSHSTTKKRSNR